jgi:hypothetical protein
LYIIINERLKEQNHGLYKMRGAILQLAENSLSFFLIEADGTTGERGREGERFDW